MNRPTSAASAYPGLPRCPSHILDVVVKTLCMCPSLRGYPGLLGLRALGNKGMQLMTDYPCTIITKGWASMMLHLLCRRNHHL